MQLSIIFQLIFKVLSIENSRVPNAPFLILIFYKFLGYESKIIKSTKPYNKQAQKILWTWLEPFLCHNHLKFRTSTYDDPCSLDSFHTQITTKNHAQLLKKNKQRKTYYELLAFFSFLISLVAHWLRVFVFCVFDLRP